MLKLMKWTKARTETQELSRDFIRKSHTSHHSYIKRKHVSVIILNEFMKNMATSDCPHDVITIVTMV